MATSSPAPQGQTPTIDSPEYRRLRVEYDRAYQKYERTHSETDFMAMYQLYQQVGAIEDEYQRQQIAAYVAAKQGKS